MTQEQTPPCWSITSPLLGTCPWTWRWLGRQLSAVLGEMDMNTRSREALSCCVSLLPWPLLQLLLFHKHLWAWLPLGILFF